MRGQLGGMIGVAAHNRGGSAMKGPVDKKSSKCRELRKYSFGTIHCPSPDRVHGQTMSISARAKEIESDGRMGFLDVACETMRGKGFTHTIFGAEWIMGKARQSCQDSKKCVSPSK